MAGTVPSAGDHVEETHVHMVPTCKGFTPQPERHTLNNIITILIGAIKKCTNSKKENHREICSGLGYQGNFSEEIMLS